MKKLTVHKEKTEALIIKRTATKEDHFVYIAVANKTIKYPSGLRSKIVYIGQTKKGAIRLAASAAIRAYKLLNKHGLKSLTYYIIIPTPRKKIKNRGLILESALINKFRQAHGGVPIANIKGKIGKSIDSDRYFTDNILISIIKYYSKLKQRHK